MSTRISSIARRALLVAACGAALPQTAAPADTLAKVAASKSITLGVRRMPRPARTSTARASRLASLGRCARPSCSSSAELKTPVAVKFEPVSLGHSFELLRQRRIDLHCGSTANTAERARQVDFSNTFFVSRVVAAHRQQDAKYASARELGRTGVLQGSTPQTLMQTYVAKKASTLALGTVRVLASYDEGAKLLKSGAIDTLVADELLIPRDPAIAQRREQLTVEPYALVVRKGEKAFVDAVNRALDKVVRGPQGKQLAEGDGVKVDHMKVDAWRNPNKQPAPPVL